jgi:hypothetical protein
MLAGTVPSLLPVCAHEALCRLSTEAVPHRRVSIPCRAGLESDHREQP